uniref:Uncharacterized protein n=1 Tax=Anguilla anguilla TaxID=7936 RepID=A0A0E9T6J7_ANGAN
MFHFIQFYYTSVTRSFIFKASLYSATNTFQTDPVSYS